jgi:hypothetical protein
MSPRILLNENAERYFDKPACKFKGRSAASGEIHRGLYGFSGALYTRASERASGQVLKRQPRGRLASPAFEPDRQARTDRPSQ